MSRGVMSPRPGEGLRYNYGDYPSEESTQNIRIARKRKRARWKRSHKLGVNQEALNKGRGSRCVPAFPTTITFVLILEKPRCFPEARILQPKQKRRFGTGGAVQINQKRIDEHKMGSKMNII